MTRAVRGALATIQIAAAFQLAVNGAPVWIVWTTFIAGALFAFAACLK